VPREKRLDAFVGEPCRAFIVVVAVHLVAERVACIFVVVDVGPGTCSPEPSLELARLRDGYQRIHGALVKLHRRVHVVDELHEVRSRIGTIRPLRRKAGAAYNATTVRTSGVCVAWRRTDHPPPQNPSMATPPATSV